MVPMSMLKRKGHTKMSRSGYEQIPDPIVEKKIHSSSPSKHAESPQERYPEANEPEAELLGLLDETIGEPTLRIELPNLTADEVEIKSGLGAFLCSMGLPTLFLILTSLIAIWVSTDAIPLSLEVAVPYLPYLAAAFGFLGSIFPIQQRYRTQAEEVASLLENTPSVAIDTVRNVVLAVASKVDIVQMRLNLVVDRMRPKFAAASGAAKNLKAMDPNIIIPDPQDLEKELGDAKEEIDESIKIAEKTLPVRSWIPEYLRSAPQLERRRSVRAFIFFFILQGVGSYLMTVLYPMTTVSAEESEIVQGIWQRIRLLFTFKHVEGEAALLLEDVNMMLEAAWPVPLVYGVAVYAIVVVQMLLVFLRTSASATAAIVNQARVNVSEQTVLVLRQQGIIFLCQDILEIRMGRVKSKLLTIIQQLYKIEMLMSLTTETNSSPPRKLSPAKATSPVSPNSGKRRVPWFKASSPSS